MAENPFDQAITRLQAKLRDQEQAVVKTKLGINFLCEEAGKPLMYKDAELTVGSGVALSIRSDQFYGQPLATCIRQILEMRKALNQGPATVNEIYDALKEGNYQFDTKNDDNAKRGLRISLTKNNVTFHKLPDGKFGLLEWYPTAKAPKRKDADAEDSEGGDDEEASDAAATKGGDAR